MYVALMKNLKKTDKFQIGSLEIFDSKNKSLFNLKTLQINKQALTKGYYSLDIVLSKNVNIALGRYSDKFISSGLYYAVSVRNTNKFFKVGNDYTECGNDILLGISDNGLGRVNKSITANEKFLEFVFKVGSKNIELMVE